ncbi:hypothetical protein HAX54_032964 [Datura stramonium]|uniref:Uncharacterized protein n=1 Tax=Datura stramonium TaxID=4076 RepID=A0ABS8VCK9_DATST|nr:hypothetical protein [Datura stramonium]
MDACIRMLRDLVTHVVKGPGDGYMNMELSDGEAEKWRPGTLASRLPFYRDGGSHALRPPTSTYIFFIGLKLETLGNFPISIPRPSDSSPDNFISFSLIYVIKLHRKCKFFLDMSSRPMRNIL